jgi:hypothetical protein
MSQADVQTSEIDTVAPEILFEVGFTRARAEALAREINRLIAASHVHGKGPYLTRIPQTRALLRTIEAQIAIPDQGDAA